MSGELPPPDPKRSAERDLDYLVHLQASGPFRHYYQRRLRERQADLENAILRGDCTPETYAKYRAKLELLEEIISMPAAELAALRKRFPSL